MRMIRQFFSLFLIIQVICCCSLYAQSVQQVQVLEYNGREQKTPLAGVSLTVQNAGSTMSDAHGAITLQFRSLKAGEPVQIRMDAFNPNNLTITDLKTCDNLDYFKNDCFRYGYAEQMAFYQEVFSLASGGVRPTVWLIAVEKRLPYRCGVWQISDELLQQAKANNERGIEELKVCRAQNEWPTRYEDVRTLEKPE